MVFRENETYLMISRYNEKFYCEILVKYVTKHFVNFEVIDSYHPANIGIEHTYVIDGAFFKEYYVATTSALKQLIDEALDNRDEQRFYELTNLLVGNK